MVNDTKTIIGRVTTAVFPSDSSQKVPVKVDTGADSSSVWASNLLVDQAGYLHFTLFGEDSPYFSGKVHRTRHFRAVMVRSSNGSTQVRYAVKISVVIGGKAVRATFTLADRSQNTYPVLVGCRLLKNKFLVDASIGRYNVEFKGIAGLNAELSRNPRAFFEKYHLNNERGDVSL